MMHLSIAWWLSRKSSLHWRVLSVLSSDVRVNWPLRSLRSESSKHATIVMISSPVGHTFRTRLTSQHSSMASAVGSAHWTTCGSRSNLRRTSRHQSPLTTHPTLPHTPQVPREAALPHGVLQDHQVALQGAVSAVAVVQPVVVSEEEAVVQPAADLGV